MGRSLRLLAFAIIVVLSSPGRGSAQPAAPAVDDAEFKCMLATSKVGGKYWVAKFKCVNKCFDRFWDGDVQESDCLPPYGGYTAQCIEDTLFGLKGVADKSVLAIRKSCDPLLKAGRECPECYSSGECGESGHAGSWVELLGAATDGFVPAFFCERAGAFILEGRCQGQTARRFAKYVYSASRCYDKCNANARKGYVAFGDCFPPATDLLTQTCLAKATETAAYYIHKECDPPPATPDGCGAPYLTAEEWLDLGAVVVQSFAPGIYCTE